MDDQCTGSGQFIAGEPPPNEAAQCPVCGRDVRVEASARGVTLADH